MQKPEASKYTIFIFIKSQAHLDKGVRPTAHGQSQLDKLDKTQAESYLEQELHKLEEIVLISTDLSLEPMEVMLVFLENVLITESYFFHKIFAELRLTDRAQIRKEDSNRGEEN